MIKVSKKFKIIASSIMVMTLITGSIAIIGAEDKIEQDKKTTISSKDNKSLKNGETEISDNKTEEDKSIFKSIKNIFTKNSEERDNEDNEYAKNVDDKEIVNSNNTSTSNGSSENNSSNSNGNNAIDTPVVKPETPVVKPEEPSVTPQPPVVTPPTEDAKPPVVVPPTETPQPPVVTPPPTEPPVVTPPPAQRTWEYQAGLSQELWSVYQAKRASLGLSQMSWSNSYASWVNSHCEEMASSNNAFHQRYPDGEAANVVGYSNSISSATDIINQFFNSAGHRENLTATQLTQGACAVYKDSNGKYFFVIGFDYRKF